LSSPPLILYRIGNALYRMHIPLLPKVLSWANRLIFGCWVPSTATIGQNVVLGYWGIGVVLHSNCSVGDNTLISQNVTIGRNKKDPGVPRIGKFVYIGAGAVITGDISIGDGAIIGANAFVNCSIPSSVVAAGIPARVIRDIVPEEIEDLLNVKMGDLLDK